MNPDFTYKNKQTTRPHMVVDAYNSRYSEAEIGRIAIQGQTKQKVSI
jgi:hypothetical protein